MEKNISIIGQGFVGSSIKYGMEKDYNIYTYDLKPELRNCDTLKEAVDKSEVIFVCVPTPMQKDGSCYTGLLEKIIMEIYAIEPLSLMVIKSTIPPGTIGRLEDLCPDASFVFNPEFLTEANANEDFRTQDRIILGVDDDGAYDFIANIYRKSFPLIPIVKMTFNEAIMVKYMTNAFLATKVIFANEFYDICCGMGIDYSKVYSAAKLDKRLGDSHWLVPGPDGDYGFGGHCFPKDVNAIRHSAHTAGKDTPLLDTVLKSNNRVRKNRDWENQRGRAVV